MRQNERLRHKTKVLGTVLLPHARKMPIQAILSRDFRRLGPMINFLVLAQRLVNDGLDICTGPNH